MQSTEEQSRIEVYASYKWWTDAIDTKGYGYSALYQPFNHDNFTDAVEAAKTYYKGLEGNDINGVEDIYIKVLIGSEELQRISILDLIK